MGTRVWCSDKTSPGGTSKFSFFGDLYKGIVTVDPNSSDNKWYTDLLFGYSCYENGYFTPNRDPSAQDDYSSTTYWNSEQSASSGTTDPKNWGGCDFAYT